VKDDQQYRELRPAVVAYLLHNGKVTEEAFSQTLLALAGDGWLSIEPQDSGVPLVRIERAPGASDVRPYEHLAFERVVRRMGALTHVPISVLTSNEGEDYETWWKRFTHEVKAEAEARGLANGLGARGCLYALAALAGAPLLAWAYFALGGHGSTVAASFCALIPSFVLMSLLAKLFHRSDLTDLGREAADWWRRNGGGLSGAVLTDRLPPGAVPSPHSAESLVKQGSQPLPPDHVWSSFGGTWRMVKVGSTKSRGWANPSTLVGLVLFGAFATVPAALIGHFAVGGSRAALIGLAPAAFFGALAVFAWLPAYRRRLPVPTHGAFHGQVVKRWTYEASNDESTTIHYCCCIDDGAAAEGWSFEIEQKLYAQMRVGDAVYVDFNPRWHKVNQIQLTAPAPGPR
jgi:predicted membrane protein DUF2207